MLIRFNVSNFLSFDKKQKFSMISGKKLKKHPEHLSKNGKVKILKFAAMFGANAAGKSNFVKAMRFAKEVIIDSIPAGSTGYYCRICDENKDKPSTFEFEIKIGGNYYAYGVDVLINQLKITGEWLYELSPGKPDELLFTRQPLSGTYELGDRLKNIDRVKIYADDMKEVTSSTFLRELQSNKGDLYEMHPELVPIRETYHWFASELRLCYPDEPISMVPAFIDDKNLDTINSIISSLGLGIQCCKTESASSEEIQQIRTDPLIREKMSEILKLAENGGTSVSNGWTIYSYGTYFTVKIDPDTFDPVVEKIMLQHEENDVWFAYSEESDGTKRMLQLLELLFAAVSKSTQVFVIDEIDRSLHPNLTYNVIETYLKLAEYSDIQVIITTHETAVMTLDMLRRDEIWFADKNVTGATELFSLDRYKERFDKCVDKAYLEGRYGAVPSIDKYPAYLQENA